MIDSGASWRPIDEARLKKARCLTQARWNGQDVLFIGTEPVGLFISKDGGSSWNEIAAVRELQEKRKWTYPVPGVDPHIRDVVVDEVDGDTLYVAVQVGGVLIGRQNGRHWQERGRGLNLDVHRVVVESSNATGLVSSFAWPGGNITGVSAQEAELSGKRLELLKEVFPKLARSAILWNGTDVGMTLKFREVERAAHALRVTVQASAVREPKDFEGAFLDMMRQRPDGLFVITDPLIALNRKQLFKLAIKNRLPVMYENSSYVDDGGLMAYGPSQSESLERALHHVDKILKGAKPGELPIEQPTKFD